MSSSPGEIVVPDSQLLDGRFFLQIGPGELRRQVGIGTGRALPMRIKPRRSTLHETLAVWLERPGSEYLNGFPFNAIRSDSVRAELALALTETKAEALRQRLRADPNVARGLARFLRELLDARGLEADDDIDVLERGWALWLEEEQLGGITVEAWDRPFDVFTAMKLDPVDLDGDLATARGRELYRRLSTLEFRSDATALIRRTKQKADDPAELLDIETLLSWYTDARHRAFAMQHGCDFARTERLDGISVGPVRRALAKAAEGDGVTPRTHHLPPALLSVLSSMPGDDFYELVTASREPLLDWWHSGDPEDLGRLIEALDTKVSGASRGPEGSPAMAQLLAKVFATGVGLGLSAAGVAAHWAIVAALLSDGILAGREGVTQSERRAIRTRIVEYGLERVAAARA
jgi:hypothetical protein